MRKVAQIMGMPITLDIPGTNSSGIFNKVFDHFRAIDEQFSPYKKDSEVARMARGELDEQKTSAELKKVIAACRQAEAETDGYFSAWARGRFDPSGYVKGWAIAGAGELLKKSGHKVFCLSAGGDILASSDGQKIWQVGIQDPFDKHKILNKLSIYSGAIATSGNYERGEHIINPKTKRAAKGLASLSVLGPDIIQADVLATAGYAMGPAALDFIAQKNLAAVAVSSSGELLINEPMKALWRV